MMSMTFGRAKKNGKVLGLHLRRRLLRRRKLNWKTIFEEKTFHYEFPHEGQEEESEQWMNGRNPPAVAFSFTRSWLLALRRSEKGIHNVKSTIHEKTFSMMLRMYWDLELIFSFLSFSITVRLTGEWRWEKSASTFLPQLQRGWLERCSPICILKMLEKFMIISLFFSSTQAEFRSMTFEVKATNHSPIPET